MKKMDDNYPERSKRIIIIHAPTIFYLIWQVIGGYSHRRTKEKIEIHSDPNVLHKFIAKDQLPKKYGGTAEGYDRLRAGGVVK